LSDTRLLIPKLDDEPWPTLGPEICDFIEAHLVHGPGDILGEPVKLTDEQRLFIYRAYEIYPRNHRLAGRRRFKRAVKSRRKGVGKTEDAAIIAICEMDPNAPVRCDGWRQEQDEWVPVGRPVRDPYIPMVAVTEEQTEDLAYAAVREILSHCALGEDYDIGLERIRHLHAPGQIQALASSPNARDGARTTFQHFDETHLFVLERLRQAHATMLRNIPKRFASDAWSLETTTAYEPGEDSIAEGSHLFALAIQQGRANDATLLYDHRQADPKWDLKKVRELRDAIKEASGDAFSFTDVEAIISLFNDPQASEANFRRYWLNQPTAGDKKWLAPEVIAALVDRNKSVPDGAEGILSFDGSYSRDSTALLFTTIEPVPHVMVLGVWEKPLKAQGWRVSHLDVEAAIDEAMQRFTVRELAPDPFGWHADVERWEERYGEIVVRFETNQPRRMGPACSDFEQAARDTAKADGERKISIEDSEPLRRHLGNCVTVRRGGYDLVTKRSPDSPDKIDLAVGAIVGVHRALFLAAHPAAPSSWRPL
jgi:hypothetical protein